MSAAPSTVEVHLDKLTQLFEKELANFVDWASADQVENLHDAMRSALGLNASASAKRIRPSLCLLAAEALGADIDRAMPFAVAIELMHTFCLVHDDIEDGDLMRRGQPSLWVERGVPHAINAGDYLLIQSHRALLRWGSKDLAEITRFRLLDLLEETLERTHVGQAMDMNARARRDLTLDDYINIVRCKTGYYLAAPIQGGALVGGASAATLENIAQMTEFLGPLFQIMDDIIDLSEGKGRDERGSDIKEGKRSYMAVWTAQQSSSDDRERMYDILDKPREETSAADVSSVIEIFESAGALEAGRAECRRLYESSLPILQMLPDKLCAALAPVFESLASRVR